MIKNVQFLLGSQIKVIVLRHFSLTPRGVVIYTLSSLDRLYLSDDTLSIRPTLLLFLVNSQPVFLESVKVLEFPLTLSNNQELLRDFLYAKGVSLVLLQIDIFVLRQT